MSSLHVLNVHIQYVHYTYTYSKNFARWICQPVLHAESVCPRERRRTRMSSESSAVKTAAFHFLCLFGRSLQKLFFKEEEREPKRNPHTWQMRDVCKWNLMNPTLHYYANIFHQTDSLQKDVHINTCFHFVFRPNMENVKLIK